MPFLERHPRKQIVQRQSHRHREAIEAAPPIDGKQKLYRMHQMRRSAMAQTLALGTVIVGQVAEDASLGRLGEQRIVVEVRFKLACQGSLHKTSKQNGV